MPRRCTVCASPARKAIEKEVASRKSIRSIAMRHGVTDSALRRHTLNCIVEKVQAASRAADVAEGAALIDGVRTGEERAERLYVAAEGILERALHVKDLRTALGAIKAAVSVMGEARSLMELRGAVTGELKASGAMVVNTGRVVLHYPQMTPEMLEAAKDAPVIDMPGDFRPKGLLR